MDPIIGGALIAGAGRLIGDMLQKKQTDNTNQQNRQFAMDMYNMQRRDTLADWARTNEYNDPSQQMARFKAAGLSPHLIYGQMNNAPAIKTPDAPKHENIVPQIPNIGTATEGALSMYFSSKMKQADLDIASQNIANMKAQEQFIKTNTIKVAADAGLKDLELKLKNEMFPHLVQTTIEKERLTNAQVANTLGQNERAWQKLKYDIQKSLSDIAKNNAQISVIPYQKRVLDENAKKIRNDISWKNVSEKQKNAIGSLIQEQTAIKNLLLGKEIDWKEVQT